MNEVDVEVMVLSSILVLISKVCVHVGVKFICSKEPVFTNDGLEFVMLIREWHDLCPIRVLCVFSKRYC
jgi:hypothetical protein